MQSGAWWRPGLPKQSLAEVLDAAVQAQNAAEEQVQAVASGLVRAPAAAVLLRAPAASAGLVRVPAAVE